MLLLEAERERGGWATLIAVLSSSRRRAAVQLVLYTANPEPRRVESVSNLASASVDSVLVRAKGNVACAPPTGMAL